MFLNDSDGVSNNVNNNGGKRRLRLAVEQREALLAFMEKNPALATGRFPGSQGAKIKAQLWNELSDYLNQMGAMGQGTTKTPDRWMKSWQDWRCDVKAKAWRLRNQNGVSSGTAQLTAIEERLLAFMGSESQEEHLYAEHMEAQTGQYSDENTHEYTLTVVDNAALTVDISSPSPSESRLSPVPSSSLSPVTCIAQSTSSYPSINTHQSQTSNIILPHHSPTIENMKQSPRDSLYSQMPETVTLQPSKRRRYTADKDGTNDTVLGDEDREVIIAERLAAAMKARADAATLEAVAEERKATAAERRATAAEREAAAVERKAAAEERLAAAADRRAAALERESTFPGR